MLAKLKSTVRHFKENLQVYQAVLADPRTPRSARLLLALASGYLLLPFDLIPDFIPVIGHLDDLIIVPLLLRAALRRIPQELLAEHRARLRQVEPGV